MILFAKVFRDYKGKIVHHLEHNDQPIIKVGPTISRVWMMAHVHVGSVGDQESELLHSLMG